MTPKGILLGLVALCVLAALAGGIWWFWSKGPAPIQRAEAAALYEAPLPAPEGPLRVYHLGHSLVGRNIPAMLRQMAPDGHSYNWQLGWGAGLRQHWEHPDPPLNGFEEENGHAGFRPADEALDAGEYDVVVLTESVELRDAIKYKNSPEYLARWAARVRSANPEARVYFYETWHQTDHEEGFRTRLERDYESLWKGVVLNGALARDPARHPIYVIPGGQVMAELGRRLDAMGGLPDLGGPEGLFLDNIHIDDRGSYLIALTHYAVIYQRSPLGLPHELTRDDGSPADAPSVELAQLMQQVVWDVVRSLPETGLPKE